MRDGRTSLQSLADCLECDTYRVLRACEANIRCYPDAAKELQSAVEALKRARSSLRQLMHEDDQRDLP
jgi:hypothetical protein